VKIVDEPAESVESLLRDDGIEVRREPYDPASRSLVSDFVGFLRSPKPGSTVILFEDENGRVRYYTVARTDPEVAALKAQIQELTRPGESELPTIRLDRIEKRLERLDAVEAKVAKVDVLEAKVAKVDELAAAAERLPELEAEIAKLPTVETRLGELKTLKTRLDRLEKR
jgi:hypothetical protein